MSLLQKLMLVLLMIANSYTIVSIDQPYCKDDERSALLQFKQSLKINKSASYELGAYPKILSWKLGDKLENGNCCLWDGIKCDEETGHVIELNLSSSYLYGSFDPNSTVFNLSHLQKLNLADNHFNYSYIPTRISQFSRLTHLNLSSSFFSGQIPSEISLLSKLSVLDLSNNYDQNTEVKLLQLKNPSFRDLFQNLTKLEKLYLSYVDVQSKIPEYFANFTSMKLLILKNCGLYGEFPTKIFALPNLQVLALRFNYNLTGHLPDQIFQQTSALQVMTLERTSFSGRLPSSIGKLASLDRLSIHDCRFSGPIPSSLGNLTRIHYLDLSSNMLEGLVPIPPPSLIYYDLSNNLLNGNVLPLLCTLNSLGVLDLSHNNFTGMLPRCLRNLVDSLLVLNLRHNNFDGIIIPQICRTKAISNLRMIDLSHNHFQGKLPKSLSNCTRLESLAFSNNQLYGTFPSWLGSLPELKLLSLRHNRFGGIIRKPKLRCGFEFPKLLMIDLSFNNFRGNLPSEYMLCWNAIKAINSSNFPSKIMNAYSNLYFFGNLHYLKTYPYTITITSKGVERQYDSILDKFAVIDFSSNKFEGQITDLIGNLKGLHLLNFSNNRLSGHIPPSLGDLIELESLDLSKNNLSGEIPQQLKQLRFLSVFNVSHNSLIGTIPQGNQFSTFDSSSFEGNSGLCYDMFNQHCERSLGTESPPPSALVEDNDSEASLELDWKFILAGLISGLIVGVAIGDNIATRRVKVRWFSIL